MITGANLIASGLVPITTVTKHGFPNEGGLAPISAEPVPDRPYFDLGLVGDAVSRTEHMLAVLANRDAISASAGRKEIIHIDVRTDNRALGGKHKYSVSTNFELLPTWHEGSTRMVDAWL